MSKATTAIIILAAVIAAAISAFAGYALLTDDDLEAAESRSCGAAGIEAPLELAEDQSLEERLQDEPADTAVGVRCD